MNFSSIRGRIHFESGFLYDGENMKKKYLGAMLTTLLLVLTGAACAAESVQKDYDAAAQAIAHDFTQRETAAFDRALDANTIIANALNDLVADAGWKEGLRRELNTVIKTKLGSKLISQMPEGAYAKVLRTRADGKKALALIRLDYGDAGTGYMDLHLVRGKDGAVRIVDWYDYSTGQLYTQSLRQLIGVMSPTPTIMGKLFDVVSNRKENINAVMELINLYRTQQYAQVVEQFLVLDENMRKNRMLSIVAVQAGSLSNNNELYHKALANLERHFHADPSMAFMLIDYYYLEQQYDKAMLALDRVQKSFGVEDAAILSLKANTHLSDSQYGKAVAQARRAIAIEPEYESSYWSLLNALILAKNYAPAVKVAKDLEQNFDYDMSPESMGGSEVFLPFIASVEYKAWRSAR